MHVGQFEPQPRIILCHSSLCPCIKYLILLTHQFLNVVRPILFVKNIFSFCLRRLITLYPLSPTVMLTKCTTKTKKFAHFLISACGFCKDPRMFICFWDFKRKKMMLLYLLLYLRQHDGSVIFFITTKFILIFFILTFFMLIFFILILLY